MKDVGKLYGHSVYFTAIWYILWPSGIFCGHFGIVFPFLVCRTKKHLATLHEVTVKRTFLPPFFSQPQKRSTRERDVFKNRLGPNQFARAEKFSEFLQVDRYASVICTYMLQTLVK
jgi:hypothetical protein